MKSIEKTIMRSILSGDLSAVQKKFQELAAEKNYVINVDDYISFVARASVIGKLDIVQYLISNAQILNIIFRPRFLETKAMVFACSGGHIHIVRTMIEQGVNPSLNDFQGYVWACEEKHHHVIEYLLSLEGEQTVYPEQTSYDITWAMDKKHLSLVSVMMKQLKKRDIFQYLEYWPDVITFYKENNGQTFISELEYYDSAKDPSEISINL